MNNRYEGRPLLRLLELYVIWAIGELSDDEAARLQQLTPKLREIYSVDGSWQDVLASVMHMGPTLPSALCGMWSRNLEIAREQGLTLTPQQFAEMIVDQNWASS